MKNLFLTAKKVLVEKGRLCSSFAAIIGIVGFIVFVASTGDIENNNPTNYWGLGAGIFMILLAFVLGSQKASKDFMKKYSNEA